MAFPPHFLDELRSRVGLSDLIGRRVKLIRKGREHTGLCPFHSEKTPSFTVSDEKGFFHCFGCGAHGDIIGFVMRTENLSFPEAVQRLADEAGVAVPEMSPEERQTAQRQASLLQVMEEACAYFEKSLRSPAGQSGLNYLKERGLDEATIANFRLGFAPDNRCGIKTALLGQTITETQLIDGGLLIKPDDPARRDQSSYDRFRGRVTFPITDRRGRVIAFGARTLGDNQPKYLNSPDTPLFHKGQVLYGLANAWSASRDENRVVVAEGYMDVIALVQAGIKASVAPLGTALTESQIALLWRMTPEPILCFDGDNAGIRAANRAAERALPMLKPGYSLRFVTLPAGEDPDTLIEKQGVAAMEALLNDARPLDRVIWDMETAGQMLDTPERFAGLEYRLEQRARAIADDKVQYQYLDAFRGRVRDLKYQSRQAKFSNQNRRKSEFRRRDGKFGSNRFDSTPAMPSPPLVAPEALNKRREQGILAALINHWTLMDEFAETVGTLDFFDADLDKLRQEILLLYGLTPDLDSDGVRNHLQEKGFAAQLQSILAPEVYIHAGFARAEAETVAVRLGLAEMVEGLREEGRRADLAEAERTYAENPTEENWSRLQECMVTAHHQNQINRDKTYPDSVTGGGATNQTQNMAQNTDQKTDSNDKSDNGSGASGKDLEINF
ncbi:MAG: DNA primase [Rhodospirillaceae bacterium]|nr:DNA primase [Rhodospirillaceae bacterium]|tara:strand:- start:742 stop:2751 length:2010 start_codon:yes stop_codon:yes gene_type:complete